MSQQIEVRILEGEPMIAIPDSEIELIRELYQAGKTRRETAVMMGRSTTTIDKYEKKLGLRRERFRGDAMRANKERARQYKAKNGKASSAK